MKLKRKLTYALLLFTAVALAGVPQVSADSQNNGDLNEQPTYNISGFKINGSDGTGIPDWNITVSNSTMEQTRQTGSDGSYMFTGLVNGTYNVSEESRADFEPTDTDKYPTVQEVTIEGQDVPGINFTNTPVSPVPEGKQPTYNISGFKINGSDGTGIPDWNITVSNSTMEQTRQTGSDGSYMFTGLVNGTYNVSEESRADFEPTDTDKYPAIQEVTIDGQDVPGINFTNTPVTEERKNSISGFKIKDLNGNGKLDQGEPGIPGARIRLIAFAKTGAVSKILRLETVTDENGFYIFENLSPGRYVIRELIQSGLTPTSSTFKVVRLKEGQGSENNNFFDKPTG